jgi:hypothetical protein
MGVPDNPEGYGFKAPEGELKAHYNEEHVKAFSEFAAAEGIPAPLASKLLHFQLEITKGIADKEVEDGKTFLKEWDTKTRAAWGNNIEANINDAKRFLLTLAPQMNPDSVQFMDPDLVIGMASMVKRMKEDDVLSVNAFNNNLKPSAQAEDIIRNANNPDHKAFHNPADPRHNEVKEKVLALNKQA